MRGGGAPDIVPNVGEDELRRIYGRDADVVIGFQRFLLSRGDGQEVDKRPAIAHGSSWAHLGSNQGDPPSDSGRVNPTSPAFAGGLHVETIEIEGLETTLDDSSDGQEVDNERTR